MTPWELKGRELVNCTCEYGCNCQFNALPDKGHCHAVAGIVIDEGRFGDTSLDGLKIAAIFKWPGPIHEGNGEALAFVDQRADAAQREALLRIMTGQDTAPFATMFAVYASTVATMHDPVFTDIDIDIDVDGRKGRAFVQNYFEMTGRPIRNPVTGAEQRAQIVLPEGFEYELAEIGSASSRTEGPLLVQIDDKYGQFARLHLNNDGPVRSRPAAAAGAARA
ncbi:DUF1326 domain-containing protein [Phenylobacterium sp.]|jgi:hypothetical protein|uniref:DUF1326 domain-containing protein n=1 Tax=Phenylobacterium sp. TaxID=1871053 RepID=UPI002F4289DF